MSNYRRYVVAALAVVALVALASCGDSGSTEEVVFGEGEIPGAFPSDFPVPVDAVIGTTLVDGLNTKSQFEFRTAIALEELARALSVGLVNQGYVINQSTGDSVQWRIDFRKEDLEGFYDIRAVGAGVTQGVAEINDT